MNLNSLIIAADTSRARLFRTAQTNVVQTPLELLEVEAIECSPAKPVEANAAEPFSAQAPRISTEGPGRVFDAASPSHRDDALEGFATQIAKRAAHFAQYHLCNPVIVSATPGVSPLLWAALERELPHVYVRSVGGEVASLPAPELLDALCKREAFAPVHYPPHL